MAEKMINLRNFILALKTKIFSDIELIHFRHRHLITSHFLSHNKWTLTHPEDNLKRDFVFESDIRNTLHHILGAYLIVGLEWHCDSGKGDIVLFDGLNTFFVIELKTEKNKIVEKQALKYSRTWQSMYPKSKVLAAFYTGENFQIHFDNEWVELLNNETTKEESCDFEEELDKIINFEKPETTNFGALLKGEEERIWRHKVFSQYFCAKNWLQSPSDVIKRTFLIDSLKKAFPVINEFEFVWAVDLRVLCDGTYNVVDAVFSKNETDFLFVFIKLKNNKTSQPLKIVEA
ncbi:hypothetical protein MHBO_003552, partial [Bonamia ostreae]